MDTNFEACQKTRAGGVCIYSRKELTAVPYNPKFTDPIDAFAEVIWLKYNRSYITTIVGCAYYLPDSKRDNAFAEYILNVREELQTKYPSNTFILAGDLNKFNHNLLTDYSDLYLLKCPPTRDQNQLDKILCSYRNTYKEPQTLNSLLLSDHMAVFCEPTTETNHRTKITIRKTGTPEIICLGLQLDKLKFENLDYCDAEQAFNILLRTLLDLLDAYCPRKKFDFLAKTPVS